MASYRVFQKVSKPPILTWRFIAVNLSLTGGFHIATIEASVFLTLRI